MGLSMYDPDTFNRLWGILAFEARKGNETDDTIQRSAISELTSDDAKAAIADIRAAISADMAPGIASPSTVVSLLAIVFGSVELNTATGLRACACAWILRDRLGQPHVQYVLGAFAIAVDDLSSESIRAAIPFIHSIATKADVGGYKSLFMLAEVFLLARLAGSITRGIPGALEQDISEITRNWEPPSTWLLGIDGSSRGDYPWDTIMRRLQGENGSLVELGAFLEKCGSQIKPDQAS